MLRGGEEVILFNLAPTTERLVFRLPRVHLSLLTRFTDGTSEMHRARVATVVIDSDGPRVSLLWISELPCHPKVHRLLETRVDTKPIVELGGAAAASTDLAPRL